MATVIETREVQNFSKIVVLGRGELIIEQGDVESVLIEADEAVMPHVKAQVEDGRLVLGLEHWWDSLMHPFASLRFRVSAVKVQHVGISGSGTVQCGPLQTEDLRLDISGSGDMHFPQLTARTLVLGISGGGKMVAAGTADSVSVRISGSGNVQTGDLAVQTAELHISGSGSIRVNAAQTLDVHISGSGSVTYTGQPQVSQRISGSGSVRPVA
jgi:hypothetical protein